MEMMEIIRSAADHIRSRTGREIRIGLILGSGLGDYADRLNDPVAIPYEELEGHPVSTVPGHAGRYVIGTIGGKTVICMQGRFHMYEGYDPTLCMIGVRIMKLLGVTHLIVTNAAGGVRIEDPPGSILLIEDHINFSGINPLRGANLDEFGPRFPDMSDPYDRELREKALAAGERLGIPLREGVYMMFPGPSYETRAEIRAARTLGADMVGMSTVPEAIAASHCGIKVLAFSVVTNHACGVTDAKLSHEEVTAVANRVKAEFTELIDACIADVMP